MKWLAAIAVVGLGHSAALGASSNAEAVSIWRIDTASVDELYNLKKRDSFLDLKILPAELVEIEGDVVDVGTTGVKATAGGQYIRYSLQAAGSNRTVYCSSKTLDQMKKGGSAFYFRYGGTYLCLVDTDGDVMLDGVYEVRSTLGSGIPIITHGQMDGYERIAPISYRHVEPSLFDNPISFRLFWESGNALTDRILFKPMIEGEDWEDSLYLDGYVGLNKGEVPGRFSFLNLTFDVASDTTKRASITVSRSPGNVMMRVTGTRVDLGVS